MKQIAMSSEDLTRIRFAISPMLVTVLSLRPLLQDAAVPAVMTDWYQMMMTGLEGYDLPALRLFHPVGNHTIDFMFPFPEKVENKFEDELQHIACTPIDVIESEVDDLIREGLIHQADRPRYKNLQALQMQAVEELALVWQNVMYPNWEKIHAVLQNDLAYRSRILTSGGVLALLQGLNTDIQLESADLLSIYTQCQSDLAIHPNGRGLLFVPFFASNSSVWLQTDKPTSPIVSYPAFGAAAWNHTVPEMEDSDAMVKLLGKNRARLLSLLAQPASTKHLALKLDLTPGAISQQLG
ncbi:MAG: hypothetical protein AAGD96_32540, partial [Chloroflexota bacterium]